MSRAFPGWTANQIHMALNEPVRSAFTGRVLDRVGRARGARDGTGPDDTLWLRAHREEGRARGRSDGQQKKFELARSIAEPADLLIWDEPLNFIDVDARELVEQAVLRDTPTLVFVEHDAAFLDQVSTRRIELVPSRRANS